MLSISIFTKFTIKCILRFLGGGEELLCLLLLRLPLCTLIIDIAHARGRRGSSRDSCLSNTCILMMWERHNSMLACLSMCHPLLYIFMCASALSVSVSVCVCVCVCVCVFVCVCVCVCVCVSVSPQRNLHNTIVSCHNYCQCRYSHENRTFSLGGVGQFHSSCKIQKHLKRQNPKIVDT